MPEMPLRLQARSRKKPNITSHGQSLAEYGLIIALIAVFCIVAARSLGTSISTMMNGNSSSISSVLTGPG
jgi:Flp pilus assembly pilin Flp